MKNEGKQLKAAGYIRVSSAGQIENESLTTQRQAIEDYCKKNGVQLTNIYADEGISGGSIKDRHQLLRAIRDAKHGKFDELVIRDLSRFGRNARELLENHEQLEKHEIKLKSIKEGMNFGTPVGKAMLTMLAAIAELESNIIKERMTDNRIAKALRGIPTAGNLPFARTFDEETEEWGLDQNKVNAIEWVYEQYVEKDRSLQQIAIDIKQGFDFSISYQYLVTVLKNHCDDSWEINFEERGEPITFKVPRILSPQKIQAFKDRLAHNRTNNRTDSRDYLLKGFLRCVHCGKTLIGQSQHGGRYEYYVHQGMKSETCKEFRSVPLKKVEQDVFEIIFDDIGDVVNFEHAIKDSLPDEEHVKKLKSTLKNDQKQLKKTQLALGRLVDAVAEGLIDNDDIREKASTLKNRKQRLEDDIIEIQTRLDDLPDIQEIKKQAHQIRKDFLEKYQSEDHLMEMTFKEKRQLLHFLFDGKALGGKQYGIYIDKKVEDDSTDLYYSVFGRLRTFRSLPSNDYGSEGKNDRKKLFEVNGSHANDEIIRPISLV